MKVASNKYFKIELDIVKDFDLLYRLCIETNDYYKQSIYRQYLKNLPRDTIYLSVSSNSLDSNLKNTKLLYCEPLTNLSTIQSLSEEDIKDFFNINETLGISLTDWLLTRYK